MNLYAKQRYSVEKDREPVRDASGSGANKLDVRNEIQEEYRTHPIPWQKWVFRSFQLVDDSRVLELGCGTGTFWKQNLNRVPPHWEILLTDRSTEMVRQARANLQAASQAYHFLGVDCQALPFPDEQFDAVLAIGLLDLIPDLNRALREAWRVLKPSGQIIVTAGGEGHLQELESLLRPFLPGEVLQQLGGQAERFGLENGEQLLSPYFEMIVRRDYNDRLVFTELSPILDYILSEQEIAWSMPLSRLGEFVQEIQGTFARSGQISVTVKKGIFVARKKPLSEKSALLAKT